MALQHLYKGPVYVSSLKVRNLGFALVHKFSTEAGRIMHLHCTCKHTCMQGGGISPNFHVWLGSVKNGTLPPIGPRGLTFYSYRLKLSAHNALF